MTIPRNALRVRRYIDGELLDERIITADDDVLAEADAAWSKEMQDAGRAWRIVIDDPAKDLPFGALVIEGPTP